MAGLLVWVLFADDRKDGTLKNAHRAWLLAARPVPGEVPRGDGARARHPGRGPGRVRGQRGASAGGVDRGRGHSAEGVASALPFTAACVVLGVAVCSALPKTVTAFLVWVAVVSVIPAVLNVIGLGVEPVARLASWLPANFFANEVAINQGGLAQFLWDTPEGLAECPDRRDCGHRRVRCRGLVACGQGGAVGSGHGKGRGHGRDRPRGAAGGRTGGSGLPRRAVRAAQAVASAGGSGAGRDRGASGGQPHREAAGSRRRFGGAARHGEPRACGACARRRRPARGTRRSSRRRSSTSSHDLRTPLTSIRGYLALVDDAALDAEAREALGTVRRKAASLERLVAQFYEPSPPAGR